MYLTAHRIAGGPPPIDDAGYEILRTQLEYETLPANFEVETISKTERVAHERTTLSYPNGETLTVHLIRPLDAKKPTQAVILVPGADQFATQQLTDIETYNPELNQLVTDSGRTLVWPVLYGSNERFAGVASTLSPGEHSLFFRDAQCEWRKDLGRTIDWLESCDHIDPERLAYLGISYGTNHPLPAVSQEQRFRALVLMCGGLLNLERPPLATMGNFLPRITAPVLMVNGRYDHVFPYETSQLPMFNLLGTSPEEKKHLVLESGHGFSGEIAIQATLYAVEWLDTVFGRPNKAAATDT